MNQDDATPSTRPYLIRALHEWCTDHGFAPYLAVQVDGSVQVPREFVKNNEIVLNVSFDATSGLKLGNEYVEFKARFGGVARDIIVPITHVVAIYARENGQGMAFPPPPTAVLQAGPTPAVAAATPAADAPAHASEEAKALQLVKSDTTDTPDTLEMSLDKPAYKSGDTAMLRVVPRAAGTALVTVLSNRLVSMQAVEVKEGENEIALGHPAFLLVAQHVGGEDGRHGLVVGHAAAQEVAVLFRHGERVARPIAADRRHRLAPLARRVALCRGIDGVRAGRQAGSEGTAESQARTQR